MFSHNAHSEDEGYDGIAIDRLVAVQRDLPEDSNYSNVNKVFVRENTTTVGRIVAGGHGNDKPFLGYSIGQGDAGRFKVTRDGVLMFKNPPDFEAPTDSYTSVLGDRRPERERFWSAARDNVYILRFRAFLDVSGTFGTEVGITVMVQVMDEPDGEIVTSPNAAPEFDTDEVFSVSENAVSVGTVSATDADEGDSITGYAITGGADRARFSIDGTTGALRFAAAPDYENPADEGSDNAYAVEVTATGGSGERAMTVAQTITVTVTDVDEAPGAPVALSISGETASGFTVRWTAPSNTGPAITDYDVQYRAGASGAWTDAGHEGTGLSLTLTGLDAATAYRVRVRAVNAEGMGVWSEAAGETARAPEARLPGKPTGLTAEPGDRRVRLEWDALRDASVTKWQYRVRSPGKRNFHAWRNIPGSGAETTSYTVAGGGLLNGETYDFQVRAVNGAPFGMGAHRGAGPASDVARVTVGRVLPAAAGVTVSALEVMVQEGGTASYTVALKSRPSASVTIAVAKQPGGDDDLRAAPASLEFTTSNWDAAQTVTVSAAGDEDAEDGRTVFAHTATSGDSAYRAIEIASVTAVEEDTTPGTVPSSDAGVTVYPKSLTIKDDARYEVVLDSKPSANVTVVVSNPRDEVINLLTPSHKISEDNGRRHSLIFTPSNWSHPQPVWMSVRNGDDGDTEDNVFALSHRAQSPDEEYDGIAIDDVLIREKEWRGPRAVVQNVYVRDGQRVVGKVLGADRSFGIVEGDASQFRVTPEGILMFRSPPDFDAPTDKAVNVLGVLSPAGDNVYVMKLTLAGGSDDPPVLVVHVTEGAGAPDTRPLPVVLPGKPTGLTASVEGLRVALAWDLLGDESVTKWQYRVRSPGRANYHAWRDVPGSGAETTSYSVAGGGLSNGETYGFQVRAVNGAPIGAGAHRGAGPASDAARVTVGAVPAAAGVTVSALEVTVPEGGTASYTVALESRPSASVTIAVAKQPGGDGDLRAAPASLEFTTSNWDAAQTVTVSAAGDEDAEDGRAVFAHTATSGDSAYRAIEIASVTAVEEDTTPGTVPSSDAGVTVYPKSLTIKDDARYEVVLDSKPGANVTVVVRNPRIEVVNLLTPSHKISEDNGERHSLIFTPSNWSHPQPVWISVRNGDDRDTEDNTFALSHAAQSPDEEYDGIAIDDVLIQEKEWRGPRAAVQNLYVRDGHGVVGKVLGLDSSFLVDGGDASQFRVTPEGILMFRSPPDFDAPTDKAVNVLGVRSPAGDNVYVMKLTGFGGDDPPVLVVHVTEGAGAPDTRPLPVVLPGKATGLTAEPEDRRVRLEWDALGDESVTKWQYRVRSPGRANYHAWRDVPGSGAETTSHTVVGGGLSNGETYDFQVRAVNQAPIGAGGPSGRGTGVGRGACDGGGVAPGDLGGGRAGERGRVGRVPGLPGPRRHRLRALGDGGLRHFRRLGEGGRGLHGDLRHPHLRRGREDQDGERAGPRRCRRRGRGDVHLQALERHGRSYRRRRGDGDDLERRSASEDVALALRAHGGEPCDGCGLRPACEPAQRCPCDGGRPARRPRGSAGP